MQIVIGSDHAAFEMKEKIEALLKEKGLSIFDVGTHSLESCHYPTYAIDLARKVQKEHLQGILLCGSGIGVSIVANRFKGVRAALCRTVEDAKLSREHNNANVIVFGARVSSFEDIQAMIEIWLKTPFAGGRHNERLALFDELGV